MPISSHFQHPKLRAARIPIAMPAFEDRDALQVWSPTDPIARQNLGGLTNAELKEKASMIASVMMPLREAKKKRMARLNGDLLALDVLKGFPGQMLDYPPPSLDDYLAHYKPDFEVYARQMQAAYRIMSPFKKCAKGFFITHEAQCVDAYLSMRSHFYFGQERRPAHSHGAVYSWRGNNAFATGCSCKGTGCFLSFGRKFFWPRYQSTVSHAHTLMLTLTQSPRRCTVHNNMDDNITLRLVDDVAVCVMLWQCGTIQEHGIQREDNFGHEKICIGFPPRLQRYGRGGRGVSFRGHGPPFQRGNGRGAREHDRP